MNGCERGSTRSTSDEVRNYQTSDKETRHPHYQKPFKRSQLDLPHTDQLALFADLPQLGSFLIVTLEKPFGSFTDPSASLARRVK
jgi:hypothetical protein